MITNAKTTICKGDITELISLVPATVVSKISAASFLKIFQTRNPQTLVCGMNRMEEYT